MVSPLKTHRRKPHHSFSHGPTAWSSPNKGKINLSSKLRLETGLLTCELPPDDFSLVLEWSIDAVVLYSVQEEKASISNGMNKVTDAPREKQRNNFICRGLVSVKSENGISSNLIRRHFLTDEMDK